MKKPLQHPENVFINRSLPCLANLIRFPGWSRSPGWQSIYSLSPFPCQGHAVASCNWANSSKKHDSCDSYLFFLQTQVANCVTVPETGKGGVV